MPLLKLSMLIRKSTTVAPGMTRLEIRLPFQLGFWLCDEKRINQKFQSRCPRYYIPIQYQGKQRWSLSFNRLPLFLNTLWERIFVSIEGGINATAKAT